MARNLFLYLLSQVTSALQNCSKKAGSLKYTASFSSLNSISNVQSPFKPSLKTSMLQGLLFSRKMYLSFVITHPMRFFRAFLNSAFSQNSSFSSLIRSLPTLIVFINLPSSLLKRISSFCVILV